MTERVPEHPNYKTLIEEARRGTGGYSEGDLRSLAKSLADAVEALLAENEKLRTVARAAVRRLEKAAQYCGDPQHPIWDGGRTTEKARERVANLLDILDPFRPELEDVSDEDWDRVYNLDPIDGFVSHFEELAESRIKAVEAERDELQAQINAMKVEERTAVRALVEGEPK